MAHLLDTELANTKPGRDLIEFLRAFNIRHVEQLVGVLRSETGRTALMNLDLPMSLESLIDAVMEMDGGQTDIQLKQAASHPPSDAEIAQNWVHKGLGFRTNETQESTIFSGILGPIGREGSDYVGQRFSAFLADTPVNRPVQGTGYSIYPDGRLPDCKSQKTRGTCVAFAVCAALHAHINAKLSNFGQKRYSRSDVFSEQHLYFESKAIDPNRDEEGTRLNFALEALKDLGVCAEHYLGYKDHVDWSHALLFETSQQTLQSIRGHALGNRISGYLMLPPSDIVLNIKRCLDRDHAVIIGLMAFRLAWGNGYANRVGEIQLPLATGVGQSGERIYDTSDGGHAVCIVGYEDDEDNGKGRPGGGSFLFRNSWGGDWAINSSKKRGYGHIPYDYVAKYWLEAAIICGLASKKSGGK